MRIPEVAPQQVVPNLTVQRPHSANVQCTSVRAELTKRFVPCIFKQITLGVAQEQ
jgi:hypothetical protein